MNKAIVIGILLVLVLAGCTSSYESTRSAGADSQLNENTQNDSTGSPDSGAPEPTDSGIPFPDPNAGGDDNPPQVPF